MVPQWFDSTLSKVVTYDKNITKSDIKECVKMLTYNNHPCALQLLNKKQRIPLVYSNAHVCLGVVCKDQID